MTAYKQVSSIAFRDDEGAGLLCLFGEVSGLWARINPCSESKRGVYRKCMFCSCHLTSTFFNPKFSLLLLTQETGTCWQHACMVHCDNLTHAHRMQWPNRSALHFLLSLNTDHALYLGPSSSSALTPLANTLLEERHITVDPNWAWNLTLKQNSCLLLACCRHELVILPSGVTNPSFGSTLGPSSGLGVTVWDSSGKTGRWWPP